jgi:hypothetical protein
VDLVMLGRSVMDLPKDTWLMTPGFVDEQTKNDAIAGAVALVAPSPYESLSLVLLEAWSHGVPTVSSARSPILVGQTRRSGGGLWYRNPAEYAGCLDLLAGRPPLAGALGRAGWRFARGLRWPVVIDKLENALFPDLSSGRTDQGSVTGEATERSRRAIPAALPGGPPQIAVDSGAAEMVREAIRLTGTDGVLHIVDGPSARTGGTSIGLPWSPEGVLADRLAMMDLIVTAGEDMADLARSVAPHVQVIAPEEDTVLTALAQAAAMVPSGE